MSKLTRLVEILSLIPKTRREVEWANLKEDVNEDVRLRNLLMDLEVERDNLIGDLSHMEDEYNKKHKNIFDFNPSSKHLAIRGLIKCPECGIYNNCTCGKCMAHGCEKDLTK